MPAYLKSDPTRGPGCGIIEVPGLTLSARPVFVLQRSSDGQCLSPGGWQAAEAPLTPEAWDGDSGLVRLAVGAQVVDYMDELDTYRITLRAPGGEPHVQTLLVQGLVYSSMHGGQGMKGAAPAAPVPPPPPPPAPEPEPEPEAAPQPLSGPESLSMTPPPPVVEEKSSKAPLLIGLLILLLAAGGGLWWYMQQQKAPTDSAQSPPQPAVAEPAPPPAPKLSPLQAAREHLRSSGDAAKSLELAKSADMQSPEAADAVFLLVEDAAQKGQGEAMLRLGAFYDPADQGPKGSLKGDPAEALQWYQKAKDAGQSAAEAKITALRQWQESPKAAPAPSAPPAPSGPANPASPAPPSDAKPQ